MDDLNRRYFVKLLGLTAAGAAVRDALPARGLGSSNHAVRSELVGEITVGAPIKSGVTCAHIPKPPPNTLSIFKSPDAGTPMIAGHRPSAKVLLEKMYEAKIEHGRYDVQVDGIVTVFGEKNGRLTLTDATQLLGFKTLTMEVLAPAVAGSTITLEIPYDYNHYPVFRKCIPLPMAQAGHWRTVQLLGPKDAPSHLGDKQMYGAGKGDTIRLVIAGFTEAEPLHFRPPMVEFHDGRKVELFSINSTANIYSTDTNRFPKKTYVLQHWAIIGGCPSIEFLTHLQHFYPHIGTIYEGPAPSLDRQSNEMAALGLRVLREDTPWLFNQRKHLWIGGAAAFDERGEPWIDMHHANIFLPAAFEAAKDVIDQAARVGLDAVDLSDYIWPWDGRYGFDPVSIAAFHRFLREEDEGIVLVFADGEQTWKFWKYFDYYHAFRWRPADLGYGTWDEFHPTVDADAATGTLRAKQRFLLYTALYHYSHLQFTQKLGLYAQGKGLRLELIPNPEDAGNGNDTLLFARLKGLSNLFIEYFYIPEIFVPGYYNLGYFTRAGRETGFEISTQFETGFGGSLTYYCAAENYLPFQYMLVAGGRLQHLKIDFWDGVTAQSQDPKDPLHEQYRRFRFMIHGFQLAQDDHAYKPSTNVMNIQRRNVHSESTVLELGLRGSGNFGAALAESNVAFDGWGMEEADRHLEEYQTVFLGGWQPTRRLMRAVTKWLDGAGTRVLVTHSAMPFEFDVGAYNIRRGINWASWQNCVYWADWMLQPPSTDGFSQELGIRAKYEPAVRLDAAPAAGYTTPRSVVPGPLPPLGYWNRTGGMPLIAAGHRPLVTMSHRKNGACVIYLHYTPGGRATKDLDLAVMKMLADYLRMPRNGHSDRYYILPARIDGGFAYALHDRIHSYDFSMTENLFGTVPSTWFYPYASNSKVETLTLCARPAQKYRFYDWMKDAVSEATSDRRGNCTIEFGGVNTGLVYLFEDNAAGRNRFAEVRTLRNVCRDIF